MDDLRKSRPVSRIWIALSASILPVAVLLSGTFDTFQANSAEFEIGYLSLLSSYLVPGLLLVGVLMLPTAFLSYRRSAQYSSAVFGFGILLLLQRTFLMWDYGLLDGRGIDWSVFNWFFYADTLLWAAVLFLLVTFSREVIKAIPSTSWILILLQLGLASWLAVTHEEDLFRKEFEIQGLPPEGLFDYSSGRNIVHIIMDSFQTDIFWELVREEDLTGELEGFVLFLENSGVTPYTSFSIPAVFSGEVFDGRQTEQEYYARAMSEDFQNLLYERDYVVNLVPEMSMRESSYSNYYDIPSVYRGSGGDIRRWNAAYLLDIVLFQHLPHFFRQQIYNDNNWVISGNLLGVEKVVSLQQKLFFKDYTEQLRVGTDQPVYHFVHLWPPHPPFVTTEDGEYAGTVLPNTRENFKNESRSALSLFIGFVRALKELRVYENSLVILQGDHGGSSKPLVDGETLEFVPTRLSTLLAVKLPGSGGPLITSSAFTSIADVAATVLKEEGISGGFPGESVFELRDGQDRRRKYSFFRKEPNGDQKLVVLRIDGSIYVADSYTQESEAGLARVVGTYAYGKIIQFGLEGNGQQFLGKGWAAQMDRYCWSSENKASLQLLVPVSEEDLMLELTCIPNVNLPVLPQQTIRLIVNGERISEWIGTSRKKLRFEAQIPRQATESGQLNIEFELPDAASPSQLGLGGDVRKLGIALYTLQLTPVSPNRSEAEAAN